MYRVYVLGSNSNGNCIYVDTGDCKLLLDVGLPLAKTKGLLRNNGIVLSDIDYILVTHEHGDHIRCLSDITSTYDIKVIASKGTLDGVTVPFENIHYMSDLSMASFDNLNIKSYLIAHDAKEPLCFSITNNMGEKLLYLTDCGDASMLDIPSHNVYIIEANYCPEIMYCNYRESDMPIKLYSRTSSGIGHLSVDDTIDFLLRSMDDSTEQIILSHLSSVNANADEFKQKVEYGTYFSNVSIAQEGLDINIGNIVPF